MLRTAIACFLALGAFVASAAQAGDLNLWVIDSEDGKVRVVSQSTGQVLAETQITADGDPVDFISGIARDPGTGEVYLAYGFEDPGTDFLGVLDLSTGTVGFIGDYEYRHSGLAFAESGHLFGVLPNPGPAVEGYEDLVDVVEIDVSPPVGLGEVEGFGAPFSPIAYNPIDGLMYHAIPVDEPGPTWWTSFDPYGGPPSNIIGELTGPDEPGAAIVSLTWDPAGYFLAIDLNFDVFRITPAGNITYVMTIDNSGFPGTGMAPMGVIINPEPSTLALYGLGLLAVAGLARRRRRAAPAA